MRYGLLLTLLVLSACAFQDSAGREKTLAELEPVRLPEQEQQLPSVSLDELSAIYAEVLVINDDPATQLKVQHRMADIEMYRAEEGSGQQAADEALFTSAIVAYETLLRDNPDGANNDQLLYQLSKAYDLNGDPDKALLALEQLSARYKDSPHYAEAEFRKAESYFSAGDYRAAEQAYANVVALGGEGAYYQNALYMHGWSQFKLGSYRASIKSFTGILDLLVPEDNNLDSLDRGQREIADDSLRVLAVVFSYEQGVDTIPAVYQTLGERHYSPLLYSALAELYLSQERYRDSAETFKAYAKRYPHAFDAHNFHYRAIKVYEKGGFSTEVIAEKESYVSFYSVNGSYWLMLDDSSRERLSVELKQYLKELASYYHALAQENASSKDAEANKQAIAQYALAGNYYQSYIDSFPDDPDRVEMIFLMAESRLEAHEYRSAIDAYERVAYLHSQYAKAADAGYSAITAYDFLLTGAEEEDQWIKREKIASELQFAKVFSSDKRAPLVIANASESLFELSEYQQASAAAEQLTRWQPRLADTALISAWLVIGHSQFEMGDYLRAENAYQQALLTMASKDRRRDDTIESLAASIYRQGEMALADGQTRAAAAQFERVVLVAPDSSIRVNAQYDAAKNYMAVGDWSKAVTILSDFEARYPDNSLTAGIAASLVVAYEAMGRWDAAAAELDGISKKETDPEKKRQSLYLSAEYYQKAGDQQQAISHYRDYAHSYPEPFPVAMEAMNHLNELYLATGESEKRRYWLNKMIISDRAAAGEGTDRSAYLAAMSSAVFSDDAYQDFQRIKLSHPLKKSLKNKQAAMKKVLAAYQKTNAYGVLEFSTLATFRIGEVYAQLSRDLIASERPENLDELALEQYEVLLEEQAYPFEEKAIAIHETNARRTYEGIYDQWIKSSLASLAILLPVRYNKIENAINYSNEIY